MTTESPRSVGSTAGKGILTVDVGSVELAVLASTASAEMAERDLNEYILNDAVDEPTETDLKL